MNDLRQSIDRIAEWMRSNGAGVLADNLAPAASFSALAAFETSLGFSIHSDLRALWLLHDGQREELNGFIGSLDFLSMARARSEHRTIVANLESVRAESWWERGGLTREEVETNAWLPFAGRDSDLRAVCCVSGRVFTVAKDVPPISVQSPSLPEWFRSYADAVTAGRFEITEGFGDVYLERIR